MTYRTDWGKVKRTVKIVDKIITALSLLFAVFGIIYTIVFYLRRA